MICTNSNYPLSSPSMTEGSPQSTHKLANRIKQLSSPAVSEGSCRVWLWGVETVLVCMLLAHMAAQVILCARLFGYASWLGRMQRLELAVRQMV